MDVRTSFVSQIYSNAQSAAQPRPLSRGAEGADGDFAALVGDFATSLRRGEEAVKAGLSGDAGAHAVVEALASMEFAVETAVTLRDKVVEAYQEILRMPV